jgi:hypothetical protein
VIVAAVASYPVTYVEPGSQQGQQTVSPQHYRVLLQQVQPQVGAALFQQEPQSQPQPQTQTLIYQRQPQQVQPQPQTQPQTQTLIYQRQPQQVQHQPQHQPQTQTLIYQRQPQQVQPQPQPQVYAAPRLKARPVPTQQPTAEPLQEPEDFDVSRGLWCTYLLTYSLALESFTIIGLLYDRYPFLFFHIFTFGCHKSFSKYDECNVLAEVTMQTSIVRDVTPCIQVEVHPYIG